MTSTDARLTQSNGTTPPPTRRRLAERGNGAASSGGGGAASSRAARPTAAQLAGAFLAALRQRAGVGPDAPVLWCYRGLWHQWTGSAWRAVALKHLRAMIVRTLQDHAGDLDHASLDRIVLHLEAQALLDDDVAPPFEVRHAEPLEIRPRRVIALANGVIDLDALLERGVPTLEPHDPRLFVTAALPVAYDPQAGCGQWLAFLEQVLPRTGDDDHRIEVLQEDFASCLLPENPFEIALFMIGSGKNGKSTAGGVLRALLGARNVSHVPLGELGRRFRLSELADKLANIVLETEPGETIDEGLFKGLVSGEPISGDRKYRDARTVVSHAKFVCAGRSLPRLTASDDGLWRRLRVVPFEVAIGDAEADRHLARRLVEAELPGILNWALEALPRLYNQGGFTLCGRCARAAAAHRAESDSVGEFADECCEAGPASEGVPRDLVYDLYRQYVATRLGPGVRAVDRTEFGRRLKRYHAVTELRPRAGGGGRRPRCYGGLRLSEEGRALDAERAGSRGVVAGSVHPVQEGPGPVPVGEGPMGHVKPCF